MYCPNCGTQNAEAASFCRSCGANLSLVPQALTGTLVDARAAAGGAAAEVGRHDGGGRRRASLDKAVRTFFTGMAFLFVAAALAFSRMGRGWWFWMFIPAFSIMGAGVAEYLRLKQQEKFLLSGPGRATTTPAVQAARVTGALPPHETRAEGYAPGSVTEGTTKLLERDRQ